MSFFADCRRQTVSRTLLVVPRLYVGYAFLRAGIGKVQAGEPWVTNMAQWLERGLASSPGFYQAFLKGTVLPHKEVFAALVAWGELLVGAALLIGLFTRFAALAALAMNANYLLAQGAPWLGANVNAAFLFLDLVVLLGAAGRAFGLDYFLAKKWPRCPLW